MAGKNTTRIDVEEGYYHVFNRGVEKRIIFQDDQDYSVYISYLKECLMPKNESEIYKSLNSIETASREKVKLNRLLLLKNYSSEISLIAYCLMPNHFHMFLKQNVAGSVNRFMNSLNSRYVTYFNKKYKRVGHLFQSRYKAVLIKDEAQYLHISRYIHKQALRGPGNSNQDQPSSYPEYIGVRKTAWIHPDEILSFFSETNPKLSYEQFVSEYETVKLESDEME